MKDGELTIRPTLCGKWSCAVCGRIRYAWFTDGLAGDPEKGIVGEVERLGMVRFLTLTLDASWGNGEDAFRHIQQSWSRLRKKLHREGYKQSFLWVCEATEQGVPHLHVFTSLWLPQAKWSEYWRQASRGSYVVDVRRLKGVKAERYVAKYCVKEHQRRAALPKYFSYSARMFGRSQDVKLPPYRKLGAGGWEVEQRSMDVLREIAARRGVTIPKAESPARGVKMDALSFEQLSSGELVLPWGRAI